MEKEKIFISGKVSGLPYEEAKSKFEKAEDYFANNGFDVWNPTRHCKESWSWLRCMCVCLWNLAKCDVVVFLKDWKDSRGARMECRFAKLLGKEMVFQNNYD